MGKFFKRRDEEDLYDEVVTDPSDQYDSDLDEEFDDDGHGIVAGMFVSVIAILCIVLLCVAGAYFASGININIRGDEVVEVPVFSEYLDQGATADFDYLKDLTWAVRSHDNVNTDVVGEYEVVYEAEYHYWKAKKVRTVRVIDNRCPVIKLKGGRKVTWSKMKKKDPGFTAKDNYDGDLTDKVKVKTKIAKDGNTATMTYTVKDSSGNLGMTVRHVFLKDVIAPKLELKGDTYISIPYGGTYTEQGYSAYDDLDGDLTNKVTVSNLNNLREGEQKVIYQVVDSSGNKTIESRTVNVGKKPVVKKEKKKDSKKDKDTKKKKMKPHN